MAEDVPDGAVDHRQLAVIPLVQAAERPKPDRVVLHHPATASPHRLDQLGLHQERADRVDEESHLHPGLSPVAQDPGDPAADLSPPPRVELQVDGGLRRLQVPEQRAEELAPVLEQRDVVSRDERGLGQLDEGGKELLQRAEVPGGNPGRPLGPNRPEQEGEDHRESRSCRQQDEEPAGDDHRAGSP